MIICGFAGIGKSTLAFDSDFNYLNNLHIIDLESTPFNNNWDVYTDVAKHFSDNGYIVLVSCHKELRETFKNKNISYHIVLPHKRLKEEYLKRYKERGNTQEFIDNMDEKWDEYCKTYDYEHAIRFDTKDWYLGYIIKDIVNMDYKKTKSIAYGTFDEV